ncbi:hypothetical protein BC332_09477 [Capsicum chinense]|nr:hypothetical protein BC332_09477 [Capsicum chinense]
MERQMSFGGGERKRGKDSLGKRGDSPLHLTARVGNLGKVKEIFQKLKGLRSGGRGDLLCGSAVEKISFKDNLIDELSKFSSLNRLGLVRGILTVVSRTVLHIGFVVSNDNLW